MRNGYPSVYMPHHELSYRDGMIYIHRLLAYEVFGEQVIGMHVHHKDENPINWAVDNLELQTPSNHTKLHNTTVPVIRTCESCKKDIPITRTRRKLRNSVYCNPNCAAKGREKISWPRDEELLHLLKTYSREDVGRMLGVSGNAVKKRHARIV